MASQNREPQDASLAALAIGVPSPRNSDFDGVRRDYLFLKCGASKAEVVEGAMFRLSCRWTSEVVAGVSLIELGLYLI